MPSLSLIHILVDKDGKKQTLKIGYIGVVPPQIMGWDKANLSGKVTVNDITETVRKYVPEMREKGADVVVVLAHSGLSADPYKMMAENSVYYLSDCLLYTSSLPWSKSV